VTDTTPLFAALRNSADPEVVAAIEARSQCVLLRLRDGWQGGTMASLYTRAADRHRLALDAMAKLAPNEKRKSIPSPDGKVRAPEP